MTAFTGALACLKCGHEVPARQSATPCPRCAADGLAVACLPVYDFDQVAAWGADASQQGIFRYPALLPVDAARPIVTLQEGGTPLTRCARLADHVGVGALYIKDETRTPTWSYKDRLAAVAVTQAVQAGSSGVVVSSTGNHGAAIAAYAAAAGIECIVLTLTSVPTEMKVLMQSFGARVVALQTGPERWQVMERLVADRGWAPMSGYVDPPLGSNPFGVEGYKSIAYEVVEQLGRVPDAVVVPTAYGDGIAGITRGFDELVRLGVTTVLPKMIAVDPLGAYRESQVAGFGSRVPMASTVSFSTGTPVATYQGFWAMEHTGGRSVRGLSNAEIVAAQLLTARLEGIYLENSSATAIAATQLAAQACDVDPDDLVVVIGTSTGLKDTSATAAALPAVPTISPSLDELDEALGALSSTASSATV